MRDQEILVQQKDTVLFKSSLKIFEIIANNCIVKRRIEKGHDEKLNL